MTKRTITIRFSNDPDLNRRRYSIMDIAHSFQGSHQTVFNMPCDEELLHNLKINGHPAEALCAIKDEYIRLARALGIKE